MQDAKVGKKKYYNRREGTWVLAKTNMEKEEHFFHEMIWSKKGYQIAW
jgi:hypothetical protein